MLPCGILDDMLESDTQFCAKQLDSPDLDDGEYENIPKLFPNKVTIWAPVVEKMSVVFVGNRIGALLRGDDEQDEPCRSIVVLSNTERTPVWPNLITMEVSDVQAEDCNADCDAFIETVESNVE